jgi:tetratricopeptide (TPR) repeat protein
MRAAGDAVGDGYGIHVPLRPLDVDALSALVSREPLLSSVDVQRLLAETGGLPSLVLPYLQVVRQGGDVTAVTSLIAQDLLEQRVSRLSQTAHQVVAAASILTGRSDADLLRETSGRSDAETVAAIDEALHAGLLVELAGGDGYDMALEALRHVLLDQIGTARRRLLHERAGRALEHRAGAHVTPADAGAIARHLNQAGRVEEAAAWHWRAADEARALHAHEQALVDVQAALALGYPAAPARLAEGEILIALGRYREAISALEVAAAASDSAQHALQVDRRLADVHERLGDYAVAEAHIAAALDHARESGQPGLASLLADHALLAYRMGDLDRAQRDGEEALAAAAQDDDPDATGDALNVLGVVAARQGRLEAAEAAFTRALQHAAAAADGSISIAALNNLARLMQQQGRSDEALRTARQALDEGTRQGDRHRLAALHTNVADLLRAAGDDEAAMGHLKQAAAIFADLDDAGQRRPEIWTLVEW